MGGHAGQDLPRPCTRLPCPPAPAATGLTYPTAPGRPQGQKLGPDSQTVSTNFCTNQTLIPTPDTGQTVTPSTGHNQTNDVVDILHILIAATPLLPLFSSNLDILSIIFLRFIDSCPMTLSH